MKSRVIRFVKDWTLPISIGLGSAIYLVFSHIRSLDGLTSGLEPFWEMCLPFCTFWVLYVTFCKVDFHKMRPARWHFLVLLAQFLIVAAIVSLTYFLELSGNTRLLMESLLACVISPVATAAPVVTQKLGGNLEEMTACAFLSNILSAVLIPVSFTLISDNQEITFLQGVGKISADVALVLLLPLACAYMTKHYLPGLHRRMVGVRDLAYYLWCVNHGEEHRQRTHLGSLPAAHRRGRDDGLRAALLAGQDTGKAVQRLGERRAGADAEEHGLRHLGGQHLPEPALCRGSRLLHPVAEHREQCGDMGARQAGQPPLKACG